MKPLRLTFQATTTECHSQIQWDEDSFLLSVFFHYSNGKIEKSSLLEKLDQVFGIRQKEYRIALGELDILLDAQKRITLIEIRTNPLLWKHEALRPVSSISEAVFVNFLVNYDENYIAQYDLPLQIIRDISSQTLSFSFGDFVSSQWISVSQEFLIGTTLDGFLSEFRITGIKGGFLRRNL